MNASDSLAIGRSEPKAEQWPLQLSGPFLSRLFIQHRLPLLFGLRLLGLIITSTWASSRALKESALAGGRELLLNLTQQLASLSQQLVKLPGKTLPEASASGIRAFRQSPSSKDAIAYPAVTAVEVDPKRAALVFRA